MTRQLSIKHYASGFIILYILVFLFNSYYAYREINELNQTLINNNHQKGTNELIDTYKKLLIQNQAINKRFADWDEVSQQLDNSDYYTFWYTHRLFNSNILPAYFKEAALYNTQGKILAKLTNTSLPEHINTSNLNPYFKIEKGIAYLILITPVKDSDSNGKSYIKGYVVTKSEVLKPLLKIRQFNYIDSDSLSMAVMEKSHIPVDEFIDYFKYKPKSNDDIHLFTDLLKQAVIRNSLVLFGFAVLFYYLISFFLSRPLVRISNYIDQLNQSQNPGKIFKTNDEFHIDELEKVRRSLIQYQKKLKYVYSNLDEKNKQLWEMAHKDALTCIYNRRAFDKHWQHIKEVFNDSRQKIALILFDVNHFKSINDSYGHPVGDKVLVAIAKAICKSLRKGEKLYRLGGDEFATILQIDKQEEALFVATRCRTAIRDIDFDTLCIKEPVAASIGIAHNIHPECGTLNDLLWQADVAVYEAKKPGHSHIVFYSKAIDKASNSILSSKINALVYDAVETGKYIQIHYQPIIDLNTDQISYYEALLRIVKGQEIIQPQSIFELVEARKLEFELDIAIFKAIEHNLKTGLIPANSGVSINVSGPSIINPLILDKLAIFLPYLNQYKIILEITETSLITNISQASETINKLKTQGFLVALDDFGSGYSSISYLSSMPVDIVKFDITLIQQLSDKKQCSIIRHLAEMITETGHQLVAEGIETNEMKQIVKQMKFQYAQGYLFGKPSNIPVN